MTLLITSDLHLTSNLRDEYRWGLFPWLIDQIAKRKVSHLLILGDLTDAKDRHQSALVNRLCYCIGMLAKHVEGVHFLKGNHDFVDQNNPFFGFLRGYPKVSYISIPMTMTIGSEKVCFLPAVRDYTVDWPKSGFKDIDIIFAHATFKGAELENGTKIESGVPLSYLNGFKGKVISGDIHVPQTLGKVTYCGAPYHTTFGSVFDPRVIVLKDDKLVSVLTPFLRRPTLKITAPSDLVDLAARKGDQVKIRVQLKRQDYATWPALRTEIKAIAEQRNWNLCALELLPFSNPQRPDTQRFDTTRAAPQRIVTEFAQKKKLSKEVLGIGVSLVESI
jgi:DNA repair exonuclease SbcCD nuclease subunit